MSLPIRDRQFEGERFIAWLAQNHAEIGIPSNAYEVVRYRAYPINGGKVQTHIVYRKESGLLTWTGESAQHYRAFIAGEAMPCANPAYGDGVSLVTYPAKSAVDGLSRSERVRAKLLARDGDECWFCGLAMSEDMTIEHLVPKSKGGGNKLDNYALAHAKCNHAAANKPLVAKIEMRAELRRRVKA